jgi:hypothetical protein
LLQDDEDTSRIHQQEQQQVLIKIEGKPSFSYADFRSRLFSSLIRNSGTIRTACNALVPSLANLRSWRS